MTIESGPSGPEQRLEELDELRTQIASCSEEDLYALVKGGDVPKQLVRDIAAHPRAGCRVWMALLEQGSHYEELVVAGTERALEDGAVRERLATSRIPRVLEQVLPALSGHAYRQAFGHLADLNRENAARLLVEEGARALEHLERADLKPLLQSDEKGVRERVLRVLGREARA